MRRTPADFRLTLVDRRQETPDIVTYVFRPDEGVRFAHLPGQAIALGLPMGTDAGGVAWRTFTVASSPTALPAVEVSAKTMADGAGGTRWMATNLVPGLSLPARGPFGRFSIAHHHGRAFAFVSAGSGATPLMSMLRWLRDRKEDVDVVYVHCARTAADILFRDELDRTAREMPGLRLAFALTREAGAGHHAGRLDRRALAAMAPDLARRQVFACGPAGFADTIRRIVLAQGGDPARFFAERFAPAEAPEPAPTASVGAADVLLTVDGRAIRARPGGNLLAELRAARIALPYACRQGLCGTCRIRCVSGTVEITATDALTDAERADGYVLACSSRLAGPAAFSTA